MKRVFEFVVWYYCVELCWCGWSVIESKFSLELNLDMIVVKLLERKWRNLLCEIEGVGESKGSRGGVLSYEVWDCC